MSVALLALLTLFTYYGQPKTINIPQEKQEIIKTVVVPGIKLGEGEAKTTLTVWIDPQCKLCRKFIKHRDAFLSKGIHLNLVPYPFISGSAKLAENIWCSKSPLQELLKVEHFLADDKLSDYAAGTIITPECTNGINEHISVAKKMGIYGTPTFLTENGQLVIGLPSPDDILGKYSKR